MIIDKTAVLSIIIGLVVALPGMSENRWVRLPSRVYVEFVRAIPLLPMLFWVFYGLPVVLKSMGLNIPIDPFWGPKMGQLEYSIP